MTDIERFELDDKTKALWDDVMTLLQKHNPSLLVTAAVFGSVLGRGLVVTEKLPEGLTFPGLVSVVAETVEANIVRELTVTATATPN